MHTPWTCQAEGSHSVTHTSLVQDQDLAGVTLLEAVCFPRAEPDASREEVTSFGTPLAALLALPRPLSASFLPEPRVADPLLRQETLQNQPNAEKPSVQAQEEAPGAPRDLQG